MSSTSTVFSQSVLKTKKKNKLKILFLVLGRVIKNNPKLFFACSLLAVVVAIINFNIGVNFKDAFLVQEKHLTEAVIEKIDDEDKEKKTQQINKQRIKEITEEEYQRVIQQNQKDKGKIEEIKNKILQTEELTGTDSIPKKRAKELVEEKGTSERRVWDKDYKFEFKFFKWSWFKQKDLPVLWDHKTPLGFIPRILILIFLVKSVFSLLNFYLNSYAFDSIERDLKKDLFRQFIRAKYPNSSEVSRNLITQFAGDLDSIANNIWLIPNRLIYVIFTIFYHVCFDFNFGASRTNWKFLGILFGLFAFLMTVELFLFSQAAKMSVKAKKRYEEDNKVIFERINNLEYVKAVSGEKYEEVKIDKQLDSTFRKNKKALWYGVIFKAVPNYLIIPSIPITFVALTLTFLRDETSGYFALVNFVRYYFTAQKLNNEMNKMIDILLNLDELSSDLTVVSESVKVLNRPTLYLESKNLPFKNGDLVFQKVVFAYPKRPQQDILQNFSFRFEQGKSYGIAGKNGIGKSTITKTTLKLYELKAGKILIGKQNIQNIETTSLHQRICYQTNRPAFFGMSIAENALYPYPYSKTEQPKLVLAAQKAGISEFIQKLPQGFNTKLREGGTDLSEGQKQQISLMRLFIRDYDIYILDEILSNVHPVLKKVILQNVFAKIKNKTVLVIDHHYEIFQYVNHTYQFTGEKLIKMEKDQFLPAEKK
ncbi:MAG: ABC transporter ATP-binding protein [Candidatus Moeniiplasma glomeromycotorum]|nr:ABC transporter ATP-binding protein [Candidatus Moeniiplasma glomeromycotorum]MCE8168309.1 ABC transporter ATP-binding protein [Candidatus Moeniiplasma glomeromycotorum]MCE8169488.1 ABC transporter ATP-binding protein [Candidatus Moeniiplasma glomeromycotorum]